MFAICRNKQPSDAGRFHAPTTVARKICGSPATVRREWLCLEAFYWSCLHEPLKPQPAKLRHPHQRMRRNMSGDLR
jgi:hypothetical protein